MIRILDIKIVKKIFIYIYIYAYASWSTPYMSKIKQKNSIPGELIKKNTYWHTYILTMSNQEHPFSS